jgi:streptogramin lyase
LPFVSCVASCSDRDRVDAVWAGGGRGEGEFVQPRALDYDPKSDTFVVIDRSGRVQRFDRDGQFVNGWRMPEWERGKPVGITVAPDGNLWIADTHYHRVLVYDASGTLLRQFGRRGTANGEFELPTDIAFDKLGRVFVSEYGGNDRIQVFGADGSFLYQFGRFGNGPGEFSRPQSLLVVENELWVTDSCNHRVQVWSLEGTLLRTIGQSGSAPGQFRFPYGLSMDAKGEVLVTEYGNTRVQRLAPDGTPLATWGKPGRLPGELAYPWNTVTDKTGRRVVIDGGNNRMQVFRF